MASYATLQQLYALGLVAQAFQARPRAVETVDAATGVLTLSNSGLFTGSFLRFSVQGEAIYGKPDAALPQGLSASILYEAVPVSGASDIFRVRPYGGSTITSFGDAGSGVFSVVVDPQQMLLLIIADESAQVDNCLTAQAPPILPDPTTGEYPQVLVGVVARRAAIRGALVLGGANPSYQASLDKLIEGRTFDDARLEEWLSGRPILPQVLDQTTHADDAPRARSGPWTGRCYTRWMRGSL